MSSATVNQPLFDLIIEGADFFDGQGSPPRRQNLAIADGKVARIQEAPFPDGCSRERIDASGQWLMPGFIDFHTHYDAEVELAPGLSESVRHGITTVFMGSCSLGASLGEPEDIADIFCRVEGVPRNIMLPMLQSRKDWSSFAEYFDHLNSLSLGPNVSCFVPHSNLRMSVMGFERSVDSKLRASAEEIAKARKVAGLASRTNTMLSLPLIMSMIGAHHQYFV